MPIMPVPSVIEPAAGTIPPSSTVPVVPQTADPTYQGVSVDTRYTPRSSLITHVEGANWTVEYYRQILGTTSDASPTQTSEPGAYQQYELIHGLLLKVTTPLETSQDSESKSMLLSGAAIVLQGFKPNVGDAFIADSGDGRAAIFTVKDSVKKSFLKDAVYQIEYDLNNYATSELLTNLNEKVVQESTFIASNLMIGMNSIVATADITAGYRLQQTMALLIGEYFTSFFSNEWQTLIVPNQAESTYDTFLTHAVLNYVTTDDNPIVRTIRLWNVDGDLAMKSKTVWDALNLMRYDLMPMVSQKVGVALTKNVAYRWPQFMSIYYSGIVQMIYPADPRSDVDSQYVTHGVPVIGLLNRGMPVSTDLSRLIDANPSSGLETQPQSDVAGALPDIVPVTVDGYYVFSAGFYATPPVPASRLEQYTLQALNGQSLDLVALNALAVSAPSWGNLERFYYVPVLIALIKTTVWTG